MVILGTGGHGQEALQPPAARPPWEEAQAAQGQIQCSPRRWGGGCWAVPRALDLPA